MAAFLEVTISIEIGQVRKAEVIDHYPSVWRQSCVVVFEN